MHNVAIKQSKGRAVKYKHTLMKSTPLGLILSNNRVTSFSFDITLLLLQTEKNDSVEVATPVYTVHQPKYLFLGSWWTKDAF